MYSKSDLKKPLTIAVCSSFSPFTLVTPAGEPAGLFVEMWQLWSKQTGIPVDFIIEDLAGSIEALRENRADIHSGLVVNEHHAKWMAFSQPIHEIQTSMFFRTDQPTTLTIQEMSGKKIGALNDSEQLQFLLDSHKGVQAVGYPDSSSLILAILQGRLDAVLHENVRIESVLASWGGCGMLRRSGEPVFSNQIVAAVRKDRPDLLEIINKGFQLLPVEVVARMEKRWVAEPGDRHYERLLTAGKLTFEEQNWIKQRKKPVMVGVEMDWPPFDFVKNANPTGYSNELLQLAAQKIKLPMAFVSDLTWAQLIDQFKKGAIDVLPAVYKTREREKEMAFTRFYATNPAVLVGHKDHPEIRSLKDLAGKRLAVVEGFSINNMIKDDYPEIQQIQYQNVAAALKAVALKKSDAFVGSLGVISYILKENMIPAVRIIDEVSIENPQATFLHVAVLKEQTLLRDIIQKGLDLLTDEEIKNLKNKYFFAKVPKSLVLNKEEKEWLAAHKYIRLGVDPSWLPFEGIGNDGRYMGIVSEYVDWLNKILNLTMTPVKGLSWQDVVRKAKAGEIDALPGVGVTPSRKEYLHFTEPYLSIPIVLVIREDLPFASGLKDLAGKRLAVIMNSPIGEKVKSEHPELKYIETKNLILALQAVAQGKADATLGNNASVTYYVRRDNIKGLKVVATLPQTLDLSIGVRKDWLPLVSILDKALAVIPEAEHRSFHDRWVNIQVESRVDWKPLLGISLGILLVAGIIFAVILFSNRRLTREVHERTLAENRMRKMSEDIHIISTELEQIFKNTQVGIVFLKNRQKFYRCNDRAAEILGYDSSDEMAGMNIADVHMSQERFKRFGGEYYPELIRGEHILGEYKFKRRDGTGVWCSISGKAVDVKTPPDLNKGVIWVIDDITEKRQARKALKESEERVKTILNSINTGIIIIDPTNREIMDINSVAARMIGLNEKEIVGRSCHKFICPSAKRDCPIIDHHKTVDNAECVLITGDNKEIPILKTVVPVHLSGKRQLLESFVDLTKRKKDEEQIQKLSNAVEQSPVWVIITDPDGTIEYVNPKFTKITGYHAREVLGKNPRILSSGQTTCDFYEKMWGQIVKGKSWSGDILNRRKNQELFWAHLYISSVRGQNGNISHFIGLGEDITEQKALQEERDDAYAVISSSINYASNIQQSILPGKEALDKLFPHYFTLWEPRDRVGGDIYFSKSWGLGKIFALGDCTGHGVPGAFMSMIANGALEMATLETPPGDSAVLLQRTHQLIQQALGQQKEDSKSDDGIDIGLCYIAPRNRKIVFSGARFSLFVVENAMVTEIKGNKKFGLGYCATPHNVQFANNDVRINPERSYYMTSDGLVDQIGGPKRRSFGKKRFKKLLVEMESVPWVRKSQFLLNELNEYQGNERRRDDVSVIGFSFSA